MYIYLNTLYTNKQTNKQNSNCKSLFPCSMGLTEPVGGDRYSMGTPGFVNNQANMQKPLCVCHLEWKKSCGSRALTFWVWAYLRQLRSGWNWIVGFPDGVRKVGKRLCWKAIMGIYSLRWTIVESGWGSLDYFTLFGCFKNAHIKKYWELEILFFRFICPFRENACNLYGM